MDTNGVFYSFVDYGSKCLSVQSGIHKIWTNLPCTFSIALGWIMLPLNLDWLPTPRSQARFTNFVPLRTLNEFVTDMRNSSCRDFDGCSAGHGADCTLFCLWCQDSVQMNGFCSSCNYTCSTCLTALSASSSCTRWRFNGAVIRMP